MENEFGGDQPGVEGPYLTSRVCRIYIEDGVGVVEVTLQTVKAEDIEAHVSLMLSLTQQAEAMAMPVLLDLGTLQSVGWEARLCGGELIRPEWNKKLVFLYHNPLQKMIAGFFAGVNRPQYPWIISSDREASMSSTRRDRRAGSRRRATRSSGWGCATWWSSRVHQVKPTISTPYWRASRCSPRI